ncbi:MAG: hypothetical protein QMD22_04685 [archaeon]|nr:hypothetical protein [archaeon]
MKAFVVSFAGIFFIFCTLFLVHPISLFYFFGPQQEASTSASIYIESIAEKITIYVPVLRDENGNVMKMYEIPAITGNNVTTAIIDTEHGKALKISGSGLIEIRMQEKHGKFKEDRQTSDEFFRGFTISMSNYTSLEPYSEIDVRVYSDSEVEKFSLDFHRDPGNRVDRRVLSIRTYGGCAHLRKGWQVVKLSAGIMCWD